MDDATEKLMADIRQAAGNFIKDHYPEEARYFTSAWQALAEWVNCRGGLEVEALASTALVADMRTGLGFAQREGLDFATPIVLATVAQTLLTAKRSMAPIADLERVVRQAAAAFGATGELLALLVRHLPRMCAEVRVAASVESELRKDAHVQEAGTSRKSSEGLYYIVYTEKGESSGTEQAYKERYAQPATSSGPRIWVDLIAGVYSVLLDRKRRQAQLTGQRLDLLCFLLRNFNRRIPKKDLNERFDNLDQVLAQLHKATFDVLRSFIDVEWGEARKLLDRAKRPPRVKLTFCLIGHYGRDQSEGQPQ